MTVEHETSIQNWSNEEDVSNFQKLILDGFKITYFYLDTRRGDLVLNLKFEKSYENLKEE